MFALRVLLSYPFHLELFSRGNEREPKVVLVPLQQLSEGIFSHTDTKRHMHISSSLSCTLHILRNVLQDRGVSVSNKDG